MPATMASAPTDTPPKKVREDYTDSDGVLMEWDAEKGAFFPKVGPLTHNIHSTPAGLPCWNLTCR